MQIRVMHKIMDQQNRRTGARRKLGKRKRRARIEVTLREGELKKLGLTQVKRLRHFDFTKLGGRYFSFWLPTVRYHRGKASREEDVIKGASRQELDIFRRTGVFGLEQYQRGRASLSTKAQRKPNRARGWGKERQRVGRGPHGFRLTYSVLEGRIYEALRRLWREWGIGSLGIGHTT